MAYINFGNDGDYQPQDPPPYSPPGNPSVTQPPRGSDMGPGGITGKTPTGIAPSPYMPAGVTNTYDSTDKNGTQVFKGSDNQLYTYQTGADVPNGFAYVPYTAPTATAPTPKPGTGAPAPTGYYRPDGGWQNTTGQGSYNANGIFDDPATKGFMDLLTQRVNALNQPYHSAQQDQLNGYLQKYFEQLQGPAYTPAQMDLLQTQALDPLESQRGSARQQVLQRLAQRGIAPSSGIAEKALQNIDQQFNQIRTRTQAGFASKAVDLDRINQQQAAGVAQTLAQLDQQNFGYNEGRAGQALQTAQIVPALARERLQDALSVMGGQNINPTSLLQSLIQSNGQQDAQSAAMMQGLFSIIPSLLGLFGGR